MAMWDTFRGDFVVQFSNLLTSGVQERSFSRETLEVVDQLFFNRFSALWQRGTPLEANCLVQFSILLMSSGEQGKSFSREALDVVDQPAGNRDLHRFPAYRT